MEEDDIFADYAEWAEDELVWGKGMYNWRRDFSSQESCMKYFDDTIEIPF